MLKVLMEPEPCSSADLEQLVDEDIKAFDLHFQKKLGNEPLLASEKAILKTFLWFKTHPEKPDAG